MVQIEIRRGVTEIFTLKFVDSSTPPVPIDFTGSDVAVEITSGGTRLTKSTADGTASYRDPYDAGSTDDPRAGNLSFEMSIDETWALTQVPSRLEVRRSIDGHVESLADLAVLITDWTNTRGL